jgi:hypothetical protein
MLFVDFYGPSDVYEGSRAAIQAELGRLFRVGADEVVVRRFQIESTRDDIELWVEVSTDEELYRNGRRVAGALAESVRRVSSRDVWVMFRVVPLAQAFLNGEPRSRGIEAFE